MGERAGRAEPGRAGPRGGVGARVASRGSRGRESPTRASSGVGRCQCELLERPPPPLPCPALPPRQVLDFHGFGLADCDPRLAKIFLNVSAAHYPERLGEPAARLPAGPGCMLPACWARRSRPGEARSCHAAGSTLFWPACSSCLSSIVWPAWRPASEGAGPWCPYAAPPCILLCCAALCRLPQATSSSSRRQCCSTRCGRRLRRWWTPSRGRRWAGGRAGGRAWAGGRAGGKCPWAGGRTGSGKVSREAGG